MSALVEGGGNFRRPGRANRGKEATLRGRRLCEELSPATQLSLRQGLTGFLVQPRALMPPREVG